MTRRGVVQVITGAAALLLSAVIAPCAEPSERDLMVGLASLRAGAQLEAAANLNRYLDGERDTDIRRVVGRVLPLLSQPLTADVREFIADNIEDTVRAKGRGRAETGSRGYLARIFPVFP